MHIDELCALFGFSRFTINKYVQRGIIRPPTNRGRWTTYGPEQVADLRAYKALQYSKTRRDDIPDYLREENITLVEFVRRREQDLKQRGLADPVYG